MEYISLGSNCSITYQLTKLGLRKQAYPFDWTKITLCQLIQILSENFDDYSESLEFVSISNIHPIMELDLEMYNSDPNSNSKPNSNSEPSSISSGSLILTNKYKIKFAHELGEKYQLDEFKNKLTKRVQRFMELKNKYICFIRIELSPLNKSWYLNIIKLHTLLSKYSSNFKLGLIICSESEFVFPSPSPSNILVYKFDEFDPNWKMDGIDWQNIFCQ